MRRTALAAWGWKEFRALLPLWLACVVMVAARGQISGYVLPMLATLAYGFGSVVLGAQSIGHEYGYGTLGSLLSQPADRRRIYTVKLVVLATFLAALWFVASLSLFDSREFRNAAMSATPARLAPLIALCGLFLAPALTMLTRSWIAGSVFTIGLPGLLWIGLTLVGIARFGADAAGPIERFAEAALWPAMYAICAVAAAAGWRMFRRLQAVEGRGAEIHLTLWPRRASSTAAPGPRRRGALGQLIVKELHLHQMSFVLAGLYVIAVAAAAAARTLSLHMRIDPAIPVTVLYALTTTSWIASCASAEERQLGTHDWQLLMPVSAWKQWHVKVGVAFALVVLLAIAMPVALLPFTPSSTRPLTREWAALVIGLAVLAASCLYVSSFSTSGVRALLIAPPVLVGAQWVISRLDYWISGALYGTRFRPVSYGRLPAWATVVFVVATVCVPVVLMAYWNHRSGDRPRGRVALQLVLLLAIVTAALVAARLLRL